MTIKDGDWTLVDWDASSGRSVWSFFDGAQTHYRTDYPVENIVKDNQAFLNDSHGQKFGEGQRVASIPLNIFYDQLHEAAADGDDKFMNKWLNDSDNRAFRTFEGNL